MPTIHCDGPWFKDSHGRTLILRGVNLGGSSKVPASPNGATYRREGFFDHRNVSFVGRPFSLAAADEHLGRLRTWGMTCLRLIVTWEAVEHAGPGQYDQEYLDFLAAVVERAGAYGMQVIIDFHQDVWSRFSGGDGAPGWTFAAAGLDLTKFAATGAALVHAIHGDPFPRMIWPTNGWKLAAATMFTLFFGGNDFAPATLVDGEPIQAYLQRHYFGAIQQVAARLGTFPHVLGYDLMNEPMAGWIGNAALHAPAGLFAHEERPSPFQAMLLGAGFTQTLTRWAPPSAWSRPIGTRVVNPHGERAWLPGYDCVWRANGVWDVNAQDEPRLLRPHHFAHVRGRRVRFVDDYWRPFCNQAAAALRTVHPDALVFVEPEFGQPGPHWGPADAPKIVYAPHWYDLITLYAKRYLPGIAVDLVNGKLVVGTGNVRRHFAHELTKLKAYGLTHLGAPTLIGEIGIPFDLDERAALRTGDFGRAERALNRSMQALEDSLLSATLWNYTADNTNTRGDGWNDEDLSLFSYDQQTNPSDPYAGGRALQAALRPYPIATAGEPLSFSFDPWTHEFRFNFRHDPAVHAPTELFVPQLHYPFGVQVSLSDGSYELDLAAQRLVYRHTKRSSEHELRLTPAGGGDV